MERRHGMSIAISRKQCPAETNAFGPHSYGGQAIEVRALTILALLDGTGRVIRHHSNHALTSAAVHAVSTIPR